MRCSGCGGTLGIDCFNQRECMEIAHDSYLLEFFQRDLEDAKNRIEFLEQFILDVGLEIPFPPTDNLTEDEDWLPF
jgi:hypothetical protein